MKVRIFVTGGTFDKEYDELTGRLFFKHTHVPEMLELGRSKLPVEITTLIMMDSLDLQEADRRLIAEQCHLTAETRILVTHGTDTMELTAQALTLDPRLAAKTIVLTGAMVPYKFGSSDGLFNLGSALAFAQSLPPGIYVAMNGRFFRAGHVKKNKQTGEFQEID